MRTLTLILFCLCLSFSTSCAKAPPNLGPAAATAFNHHQAQKALDLIRDVAQDANATVPPVLSTETTRKVTLWHQSAITIIHDSTAGWQTAINSSLDELLKNIPATERQTLLPYVTLAKTILTEATR